MLYHRYDNIPRVLRITNIIDTHDPLTRILDISIGWGKYALLLREQHDAITLTLERKFWNLVVDGVDTRAYYHTSHTSHLYDTIYITPITEWAEQYRGMEYDVVIWAEGIQYTHAEDVQKTVNNLLDFCKWLIIVTPNPKTQPFNIMNNVKITQDSIAWDDHSKIALLKGVVPSSIKKEDIMSLL